MCGIFIYSVSSMPLLGLGILYVPFLKSIAIFVELMDLMIESMVNINGINHRQVKQIQPSIK